MSSQKKKLKYYQSENPFKKKDIDRDMLERLLQFRHQNEMNRFENDDFCERLFSH